MTNMYYQSTKIELGILIYFLLTDLLKIEPERQSVRIGLDAIFTCDSETALHWNYQDGSLPKNARTYNNTLQIVQVMRNNRGYYECERNNSGINFFALGQLKVIGKESVVHKFVCYDMLCLPRDYYISILEIYGGQIGTSICS